MFRILSVLFAFAIVNCLFFNQIICNDHDLEKINDDKNKTTEICYPKFCTNSTMQSDDVMTFCNNNYLIDGRCCLNTTQNDTEIIGLDYSSCNFDHVNDVLQPIRDNLTSVKYIQILDIRNNTIKECDSDDFAGFLTLNQFYFPDNCNCPGGNYSWKQIKPDSCIGIKNICTTNYTNTNCTETSMCVANGPGNFLCLCKPGYYGYKCMKKEGFPTLSFTLSFCIGTVFFCGLLYHTQRRHVISDSNHSNNNNNSNDNNNINTNNNDDNDDDDDEN